MCIIYKFYLKWIINRWVFLNIEYENSFKNESNKLANFSFNEYGYPFRYESNKQTNLSSKNEDDILIKIIYLK